MQHWTLDYKKHHLLPRSSADGHLGARQRSHISTARERLKADYHYPGSPRCRASVPISRSMFHVW